MVSLFIFNTFIAILHCRTYINSQFRLDFSPVLIILLRSFNY